VRFEAACFFDARPFLGALVFEAASFAAPVVSDRVPSARALRPPRALEADALGDLAIMFSFEQEE